MARLDDGGAPFGFGMIVGRRGGSLAMKAGKALFGMASRRFRSRPATAPAELEDA